MLPVHDVPARAGQRGGPGMLCPHVLAHPRPRPLLGPFEAARSPDHDLAHLLAAWRAERVDDRHGALTRARHVGLRNLGFNGLLSANA